MQLNDLTNILFTQEELLKLDYLQYLEITYKEDDFDKFVSTLKTLDLYNKFKNSVLIKNMYNKASFDDLLKEMSFELFELYSNFKDAVKIFHIWNSFFNIYISIKDNCYPKKLKIVVKMVTEQTFSWLKLLESKYTSSRITPYEHAFGEHLGEMIERFGDINLFNMQGLEKLNHLTTMHFFNSTNKHPSDYLLQLIKKRNRLELCYFINTFNWENWESELKIFLV